MTDHVSTGPQYCAAAAAQAAPRGPLTTPQVASAYGLSGLYSSGLTGQGVTVGVYELGPYTTQIQSDVAAYQSCYGTAAAVSSVSIDGESGAGCSTTVPDCAEVTLDVENLVGLAPNANVVVYEAPDSGNGPAGPVRQDRHRRPGPGGGHQLGPVRGRGWWFDRRRGDDLRRDGDAGTDGGRRRR